MSSHFKRTDFTPYPERDQVLSLASVKVEAISAICYRCTPQWKIEERVMPNDIFLLIISGRARFRIAGRKYSVVAGDCLHMPRNRPQSATGDPVHPVTAITIHYQARAFGGISLADLANFPCRLAVRESLVPALMEEACREFFHKPAGWREGLNAKTWELLLHFIRHGRPETPCASFTPEWRQLARLQPALQKMDETLAAPVSVAVLARSCGYSVAQFRRVFRRAVGLSPVAWLRQRRMEEACLLLQETEFKIEDISTRVGYAEPAFFWTTFRKLMGRTPAEFRRLGL